jgi:hypothetical protein
MAFRVPVDQLNVLGLQEDSNHRRDSVRFSDEPITLKHWNEDPGALLGAMRWVGRLPRLRRARLIPQVAKELASQGLLRECG